MKGRVSYFGMEASRPSLWNDIVAINSELAQYATARDKVHYFESKVFFVDAKARKEKLRIRKNLMPDRLHPSADGYRLWAAEIVRYLETIVPT